MDQISYMIDILIGEMSIKDFKHALARHQTLSKYMREYPMYRWSSKYSAYILAVKLLTKRLRITTYTVIAHTDMIYAHVNIGSALRDSDEHGEHARSLLADILREKYTINEGDSFGISTSRFMLYWHNNNLIRAKIELLDDRLVFGVFQNSETFLPDTWIAFDNILPDTWKPKFYNLPGVLFRLSDDIRDIIIEFYNDKTNFVISGLTDIIEAIFDGDPPREITDYNFIIREPLMPEHTYYARWNNQYISVDGYWNNTTQRFVSLFN
jgi:hypothetical protein